ncbi:MAG: hypothetical protein LBQ51_05845 [Desulfovibrio sp.]|jgi:hypothetical protein|nr:hypothetical protein [Desulfovibrio sp.]
MPEKTCLLHANCQGEELETLLRASRAFSSVYRIVRRTNYTREPILPEDLDSCSLFLYQQLGAHWGDLASEALLRRLPAQARSVRIPNLFFKGYWPFWTASGPISFGDSLLNRLVDEGASKEVILGVYLRGKVAVPADFQALFEESPATAVADDPEDVFGLGGYIQENWKKRMLFHTVNHPGAELLSLTADGVLRLLGFPPLSGEERADVCRGGLFPSYADFDLPVHPATAAFHGLPFAGQGALFNIFGRAMTFEQYVSRYIDCRLAGLEDDFIGYLQLV